MEYQVLLYYKYTSVKDPQAVMLWQKSLCERLGLKGRIIIAEEGINGTVEGTKENTILYIRAMREFLPFKEIKYKKSKGTGKSFKKLSIKVRKDIVSDKIADWEVNPNETTGKYLSADKLHEWITKKKDDFVIIDMRNDYEHKSGHFEGSVLPQIETFRDLPKAIPQLKQYEGKTIVTVCTGGVRCEKASGFLIKNGFKDVYQLKDGIVTYMEKYPNQDFKGKLYVFDERVLMGFQTEEAAHEVIGMCVKCGLKSEHYINCKNDNCHRHLICCENCIDTDGMTTCPQGCRKMK
ncbi:MAG TPA: rhodanese-related sulfurtransferase [Candidatus Saccharimonadales bacterium]|nr:rhodanese-related sulfurtransferase [Candidatus Saccharimonadales bacterium]